MPYAIMRFAKYKGGGGIGGIEAHDEREKDEYKSNPDVDLHRTDQNFHLVEPQGRYRAEIDRQIQAAGCRVRKDSVRMVEVLFTASPDFFKHKKQSEVRAFFEEALTFFKARQNPETILSAVVHMDEKTPHMHLVFVPLTEDHRLSAKDIVGNRKKLTWWQDEYWKHMVKKYPTLERGESASKTGRAHIPPSLFKEAVHLNRQKEQLLSSISQIGFFNKAEKVEEIQQLLNRYIPGVEAMHTDMKKLEKSLKDLKKENKGLKKEVDSRKSVLKPMEHQKALDELNELKKLVGDIPPEILQACTKINHPRKEQERE